MTLRVSIVAIVSCASTVLFAGNALAITLPDSGSCADSRGNCLSISNTSSGGVAVSASGSGGIAVSGGSSSGTGVSGGSTSGVGVSGSSSSNVAVRGTSGSSVGVYGTSTSGYGVQGNSPNNIAVYGFSTNSNGLVGQNNRNDHAAAAISALTGDVENGLAYYGNGGLFISSSYAEKSGSETWFVRSDSRLKRDVAPLRMGLDQLKQVRPVTFKYNGLGGTVDNGHEYVGVLAQELEKVFPNMVTTRKGKLHPTDTTETDIKVVDAGPLTYVLVNAVKEQQAIIERQERRIAALEHGGSVKASLFGTNGLELGLGAGLLPLGFVALRRRKEAKIES